MKSWAAAAVGGGGQVGNVEKVGMGGERGPTMRRKKCAPHAPDMQAHPQAGPLAPDMQAHPQAGPPITSTPDEAQARLGPHPPTPLIHHI